MTKAILCGDGGHAGDQFSVDFPVDEKESHTDVEILQVVPDDHYGSLTSVILKPLEGRRHQLRLHMAQLGIPIVNDVPEIYALAEANWLKRHGTKLPQQIKKAQGLFLQAVKLEVPSPLDFSRRVMVEVDVSKKFHKLLERSVKRQKRSTEVEIWCSWSSFFFCWIVGVSKNGGTPKWMVYKGNKLIIMKICIGSWEDLSSFS